MNRELMSSIAALALTGCSDSPPLVVPAGDSTVAAVVAPAPPAFSELPLSLTIEQRSTSPIPGSGDRYALTIDDITRGQVMVSLQPAEGAALFGPVSMAAGQSRRFAIGGVEYLLTLESLDNQLVGDDAAAFTLDVASRPTTTVAPRLTEAEKIERLIAAVAALEGAVFVRNGADHAPAAAAEHLRAKLEAAGESVSTAQGFIDGIGSQSSLTGEAYTVRYADGRTQTAREFLRAELLKLEKDGR